LISLFAAIAVELKKKTGSWSDRHQLPGQNMVQIPNNERKQNNNALLVVYDKRIDSIA